MTTINNTMEKGFITILPFMTDELCLNGNELIVYAFLYGFSQEGKGEYFGGLQYLMKRCGIKSNKTAIEILAKMTSEELVIKSSKGLGKVTAYRINNKAIKKHTRVETTLVQKLHYPRVKSTLPTRVESTPIKENNIKEIYIEKENIKEKEPQAAETTTTTEPIIEPEVVEAEELKKEKSSAQKERKTMERPTLDEVRAKIMEKGYSAEAEAFWNYYESNGWKVGKNPMKKWESALVTWQKKENEHKNRNYGTGKKFNQQEYLRNEYRKTFGVEPDF